MKFLNAATLMTLLRYLLQAIGGVLVANGKFDPGAWDTISGAVLVLLPALFGVLASNADKAVVNGKTVAVKDLPQTTQDAVKASVKAAPKVTIFELLFGVFFKKT